MCLLESSCDCEYSSAERTKRYACSSYLLSRSRMRSITPSRKASSGTVLRSLLSKRIRIQRKLRRQLTHIRRNFARDVRIVGRSKNSVDEPCNLLHLSFLHSARSNGRRSNPDSTRDERRLRLFRHGVLV